MPISDPIQGYFRCIQTYVWPLLLLGVLQNLPKHVDRGVGLDGNTGQQALVVDIPDQSLWICLLVRLLLGALRGAGEGGLVVEAIQVAACLFEFLNPFLGLHARCKSRHVNPRISSFLSSSSFFLLHFLFPHCIFRGLSVRIRRVGFSYLSYHHMAIEGALCEVLARLVDMASDLGHDRSSKRNIGYKMPVPIEEECKSMRFSANSSARL